MKPNLSALLNAMILVMAIMIRSNTPISAACCVTMDIEVVPKPTVVGITTPNNPSKKPPSVPRIIGFVSNGLIKRSKILVKITKSRATGTAIIPNNILNPNCHSSK